MVQVGGPRNNRRKWIHAFQDQNVVFFASAISPLSYLLEDANTNQWEESVLLLEELAESKILEHGCFAIIITQVDLLWEALASCRTRIQLEKFIPRQLARQGTAREIGEELAKSLLQTVDAAGRKAHGKPHPMIGFVGNVLCTTFARTAAHDFYYFILKKRYCDGRSATDDGNSGEIKAKCIDRNMSVSVDMGNKKGESEGEEKKKKLRKKANQTREKKKINEWGNVNDGAEKSRDIKIATKKEEKGDEDEEGEEEEDKKESFEKREVFLNAEGKSPPSYLSPEVCPISIIPRSHLLVLPHHIAKYRRSASLMDLCEDAVLRSDILEDLPTKELTLFMDLFLQMRRHDLLRCGRVILQNRNEGGDDEGEKEERRRDHQERAR